MADWRPPALDDAIKGKHWAMAKALGKMSPRSGISYPWFPMANHHPVFPMLARFPVEQWRRAGAPCLSDKGWCTFCIRLYQNNQSGLQHVFEVAQQELESSTERGEDHSDLFDSVSHYRPRMWPGGAMNIVDASTEAPDGVACLSEVESEHDTDSDGLIEV